MLLGLRSLNTKPKFRAADTNAASSGDCAWYSSLPVGKTNVNLLYILYNTLFITFEHYEIMLLAQKLSRQRLLSSGISCYEITLLSSGSALKRLQDHLQ
jgi:hypothetical protein